MLGLVLNTESELRVEFRGRNEIDDWIRMILGMFTREGTSILIDGVGQHNV
jgi:hypothetical protein